MEPPHPSTPKAQGLPWKRGGKIEESEVRKARTEQGLLDTLGHHTHELPEPVVACTKPTESEAAIALAWRQWLLSPQPLQEAVNS